MITETKMFGPLGFIIALCLIFVLPVGAQGQFILPLPTDVDSFPAFRLSGGAASTGKFSEFSELNIVGNASLGALFEFYPLRLPDPKGKFKNLTLYSMIYKGTEGSSINIEEFDPGDLLFPFSKDISTSLGAHLSIYKIPCYDRVHWNDRLELSGFGDYFLQQRVFSDASPLNVNTWHYGLKLTWTTTKNTQLLQKDREKVHKFANTQLKEILKKNTDGDSSGTNPDNDNTELPVDSPGKNIADSADSSRPEVTNQAQALKSQSDEVIEKDQDRKELKENSTISIAKKVSVLSEKDIHISGQTPKPEETRSPESAEPQSDKTKEGNQSGQESSENSEIGMIEKIKDISDLYYFEAVKKTKMVRTTIGVYIINIQIAKNTMETFQKLFDGRAVGPWYGGLGIDIAFQYGAFGYEFDYKYIRRTDTEAKGLNGSTFATKISVSGKIIDVF